MVVADADRDTIRVGREAIVIAPLAPLTVTGKVAVLTTEAAGWVFGEEQAVSRPARAVITSKTGVRFTVSSCRFEGR